MSELERFEHRFIDSSLVSKELGRSSHTERRDNPWHRPVTWCIDLLMHGLVRRVVEGRTSSRRVEATRYIHINIHTDQKNKKLRFVESQCLTCFPSFWHGLAPIESSNLSFLIRIHFLPKVVIGFFEVDVHTSKVLQVSFIRWTTVQTASITSWLQAILSLPYTCRKKSETETKFQKATVSCLSLCWSMSPV